MFEEALYRGPTAPVFLSGRALAGLRDRFFLRDCRGRSSRPSLAPLAGGGLEARGPFLVHQEYFIPARTGADFVRVIDDPNQVHTSGGVVAGVMTASKMLLPLEILCANLDIVSLKAKFTAPAYYDRRTVNHMRVQHVAERELEVGVTTYQWGERVAQTLVRGRLREGAAPPAQPRRPEGANLERVQAFCAALDVPPELFFARGGAPDYCYPLSYLSSLTSGEFVKQLQGQGGLMNVLQFEFEPGRRVPIEREAAIQVQLERGRPRATFNRVLAKIIGGLVTYCRGSAVLTPHSPLG